MSRPPDLPPARRPHTSRHVLLAGLIIFAFSALLISLPLLLGRWDLNKYLVASGFVGLCLGASCLLHGLWDALRGTRPPPP